MSAAMATVAATGSGGGHRGNHGPGQGLAHGHGRALSLCATSRCGAGPGRGKAQDPAKGARPRSPSPAYGAEVAAAARSSKGARPNTSTLCLLIRFCRVFSVPCWMSSRGVPSGDAATTRRTNGRTPDVFDVLFKTVASLLSVWGQLIFCFSIFIFMPDLACYYIKGMGKSFLLSKDEPLTPNIDGVVALWFFRSRRRAQKAKNWQKLDL